jgi:hypothetical protein
MSSLAVHHDDDELRRTKKGAETRSRKWKLKIVFLQSQYG